MHRPAPGRGLSLWALACLCGCQGNAAADPRFGGAADPREGTAASQDSAEAGGGIPAVRIGERELSARALAAEAAFLFPQQTRALVHALLRNALADAEAQRLALSPDEAAVDRALEQAVTAIRAQLTAGADLEQWAREGFGRSWVDYQAALRLRLRANQIYQLCARAGSREVGRVRLQMLVGAEQEQADGWARRLRAGASAAVLAAESLDPGPAGDASLPPLPVDLAAPLGKLLFDAPSGTVLGPFQFEGDPLWRVVLVQDWLPPIAQPPAVAQLLADLAAQPLGPLEALAWFERNRQRYNALENLPALIAPEPAFEPSRRP